MVQGMNLHDFFVTELEKFHHSEQHLDNLRRKSSAQRSGNSRVSVHLCNDSASNIEGSANGLDGVDGLSTAVGQVLLDGRFELPELGSVPHKEAAVPERRKAMVVM